MRKLVTILTISGLVILLGGFAFAQPTTGQIWEKNLENPVFLALGAPGSWNGAPPTSPIVFGHGIWDGSEFKFYLGGNSGINYSIGLVTAPSLDGDWSFNAGNPIFNVGAPGDWDGGDVGNASVLIDLDGVYQMWYAGEDTSGVQRIGHATSGDGIVWTKNDANPVLEGGSSGAWDGVGVRTPNVVGVGTTYMMWFTGESSEGATAIGLATSSDGVSWAKEASNPVFAGSGNDWDAFVQHPSVLKIGDDFHMWYIGQNFSTLPPAVIQTGYAVSSDGINWTASTDTDENPVLATSSGSWDAVVAAGQHVFKLNDSDYGMIYGGTDLLTVFGAGVASATFPPITGIDDEEITPVAFSLQQNYPNPFNPTTRIQYNLPTTERVTLKVFNVQGQEIATLVNGSKAPGAHVVEFDGSALASGVYLYRIEAGEFSLTRKMLLVR